MSRRRAVPHDDPGAGADVPELLSTPTWPPSSYQPLEPPPGRPRYVGIILLALLVSIVGAAAYLLRDRPPPETVDEAELNRLIAEKRAELLMAERTAPVTSSDVEAATSQLYVESNPSGAVVLLDADTIGITPISGRAVKTGVYVLSLRKEDFAPHDTVIFILEESSAARLVVDLAPGSSQLRGDVQIASTAQTPPPPSRSAAAASGTREANAEPIQPPRRQPEQIARDGASRESARGRTTEPSARRTADQEPEPSRSPAAETTKETTPVLTGLVTVLVRPWGSIYIDGNLHKVNTDVQHTAALPEGRHVVRVEHPALGAKEQVVEIRNGQPRHIVFDLLKRDVTGANRQDAGADRSETGSGSDGSGGGP